ncbi:MAG: cobyrinic acid a,c-diamide synthase, partial [Lachnospiraceae bacterium]|nr:cobyrinic acid a,c-diamide synthase [Lachnospiraceae bacterium]
MGKVPRVLFAAPKSGSGKTMITCGIIELLKRRNQRTASFKCGPDYIDPMFHRQVLGVSAGNLDTYFTDAALTRRILMKRACSADITVIEGVMGYYDGLGGQSEEASTYEVARITETPVILIA